MSGVHAPLANHLVVRLADEGVPLSAMCRALRRPFDEVLTIVTEAKGAGQILAIPASDWPPGSRRDARSTTHLPLRAAEIDEHVTALMVSYGLTSREATLVATLLRRPDQTKATLHAAICGVGADDVTHPKIVDVFICKARRKLRAHGIAIETVWGRGYRLSAGARETLLAAIAAYHAAFTCEAAE